MFESGGIVQAVAAVAHQLASLDRSVDDRTRIDLIRALEELKSSCAAAQVKATADLDASRRAAHAAAGVPPPQRGRGVGAEVALARRTSPYWGGRHLGFAKALVHEMPSTLALLESGVLSEWRATLLVRETACLSRADRAVADRELCADPDRLYGLGDKALIALVRSVVARIDVEAVVRRNSNAVTDRRVSVRPAPDTMSNLSALLPVRDGVAVYATLRRDADSVIAHGDKRTRSQIMADLLVRRVTGLDSPKAAPITVNLVVSDQSLLAGGTEPAHIPGFGPIPAAVARDWIATASDPESEEALLMRRIYANPATGAMTATESTARRFPAGLARWFEIRDRTCRTPYCGAPIRHNDHIEPHENGGATTAENGAGLCEACNHAKQAPGWTSRRVDSVRGSLHRYVFTTPTGHRYRSTAPPLPMPLPVRIDYYRPVEKILVDFNAAA